jgi:hypothetical protein
MSRFLQLRLLLGLCWCIAASVASGATTYYVRVDGGTPAQCTGKVDAAYPGTGSAQACAWHHPFDALPPNLDAAPPPPARIAGGDTVIIDAGSYEMGLNAPGAKTTYSACNPAFSYDCHMQTIPSGPSAILPTRILGKGWDTGCAAPPELWGSEHSSEVFLLQNNANIQISCLEITDHSNCIESHFDKNVACNRNTPPYGNWASYGIYASSSSNVTLSYLNIHGMANRGILNGKLSNWTLDHVHIVANGWAGWDGDLGCGTAGCSSASGNMVFKSVEIAWNGCTENYPTHNIYACWAQTDNGYGDGFGTAQTGGNWSFTDSYFHHNTSDGLDLLYADGTGTITVERSRSEGNAGNQMKLAGNSLVENSVIVGNCSYFQGVDYIIGNNSNSGNTSGDNCRALGNALVVSLGVPPKSTALHSTIRYNSIIGQGDCLILAINGAAATSKVAIQNNLLIGQPFWITNDGTQSCLFFWDTGTWSNPNAAVPVSYAGNWAYQVKPNTCPAGSNCTVNPQVLNASLASFNPLPELASPLIGAAQTGVGTVAFDFRNQPRPGVLSLGYDIGAMQYQGLCDDVLFDGDFDGAVGAIVACTGSLISPDTIVPPHP